MPDPVCSGNLFRGRAILGIPDTLTRKEDTTLRFLKDNRGIESTEVALIIAVVVLVSYGAYRLLGENIAATVNDIAGKV